MVGETIMTFNYVFCLLYLSIIDCESITRDLVVELLIDLIGVDQKKTIRKCENIGEAHAHFSWKKNKTAINK